jgi:hypothetical protein
MARCLEVFLNPPDEKFDAPTEMAMSSYHDFCLRSAGKNSYTHKIEAYRRCQRAIKAFMEGEPLKLVKPCSEDLFPIDALC